MQTIDRFHCFPGGQTRYFPPAVGDQVDVLRYGSLSTSETRGDLLKALIDALCELPAWQWMQKRMAQEAKAAEQKPPAGSVATAPAEPFPAVDKFAAYKRWKATREANQAQQYARTGERVRYSKESLDAAHQHYQKAATQPQREKYAKVAKDRVLAKRARGEQATYHGELLELYNFDRDAMRGASMPPAQVDRGTAVAVHSAIRRGKYSKGESTRPWWDYSGRTQADAAKALEYAKRYNCSYNEAVAATA